VAASVTPSSGPVGGSAVDRVGGSVGDDPSDRLGDAVMRPS
jgi:hypothetical protein